MHTLISTARLLFVPLMILIGAHLALPHAQEAPEAFRLLLHILPYAACAIAAGLGIMFGQGRVVGMALLLALAYWSVTEVNALLPGSRFEAGVLFTAVTTLVPLNLLLFTLLPERGVFTRHAVLRFLVVALQAGFVTWVIAAERNDVLQALAFNTLNAALPWLHLSDSAVVALVIAVGVLLWVVHRRGTPLEAGALVMVGALALLFGRAGVGDAPEAYASAAGLILLASLVFNTHYIAYRDDLTGLPARRALNQRLAALGRNYAIAMLDVDHFKKFNDTHGHDVGDQVLKLVAARIRAVGGRGKAYRYGGEEFTIVFPGKTAQQARPYLEEVRETIADYRMVLRGGDRPDAKTGEKKRGSGGSGRKTVQVTISIGVAERTREIRDAEEVIKAADAALYRAKKKGRNRVAA
ncbi:GGDEF domain-containing protein [Aquisalimonas asiatica]|uniref:diguanylate cyclase n=1 Tax=Aquisalimonas asiatica TaxID=406100 RepID=A0A1H8Q2W9_9GAMM|nr:GGDEF domain-containing protein [Aquisalimonas asiatica]SEO48569.1 diguanylate cyclase (GGDEF) domain-containing protein [Aquisalimonas asiatica]